MTQFNDDLWTPPPLSARQAQHRAELMKAIRLAQDFEASYRPRSVECPGDSELIRYVAYAHLIRAIELCRGVLDLRENPIQYVLIRVLVETFVNLQFIECEPEKRVERAKDFYDFWDVNRWRLLQEIGRRFPDVLREVGITDENLKANLDIYRDRFDPKQKDWTPLTLVARVEAYAKILGTRDSNPALHQRILALYKETHPYVHSGMPSLMGSLIAGDGTEWVRPRITSEERDINPTLSAAALLVDLLATCTRILDCSDFDDRIKTMSKELFTQ